ncbi:MAG: glycosyltransferase family 1 protein [Candidatus Wallbacteria bacterium]|nr:glycosyltransferase family 1 protein [Candidatus Wallbacteria bacterium]
MRIGIQTWGSDGDIRPLIALGGGLASRGHEVTLAVGSVDNKDYGPACEAIGIRYVRAPVRIAAEMRELAEKSAKVRGLMPEIRVLFDDFFFPYVDEMFRASTELAADCDLLVGHFIMYPLKVAARLASKPYASVTYWPGMVPTSERPPGNLPNLSRWTNRAAWELVKFAIDRLLRSGMQPLWKRAGLPPFRRLLPDAWFSEGLNLIAASPALWQPEMDWGPVHRVCGYFHMPAAADLAGSEESLAAFLDSGPAPVFMGLGSTQQADPERAVELLRAVSEQARCRAIVHSTVSGRPPGTVEGSVYFVGQLSHAQLFPRCAAVLHHGGAGTTHTALRAGRASVAVPFLDEQYSWGLKAHRSGVAGPPLWYVCATPSRLAESVRSVLGSASMQAQARRLGERMRSEDGVATAVAHLENYAAKAFRSRR